MSGSGPVGPACTLLHIQVDEHGFTMPFTGRVLRDQYPEQAVWACLDTRKYSVKGNSVYLTKM